MIIRNFFTALATSHVAEYNSLPSETEQGDTPTIRTILERYTKGLPLGVSALEPQWYDEDLPDFASMDLAELAEYREELANRRFELEAELEARKNPPADPPADPPVDPPAGEHQPSA